MDKHFFSPLPEDATPDGRRSRWIPVIAYVAGACFVLAAVIVFISTGPGGLASGTKIVIEAGSTLNQTASLLKDKGIIRSTFVFKVYAVLLDGTTGVKTGDYLFNGPESALRVAYRLDHGIQGFPVVKVTIPEGSDSGDIAKLISKAIPDFDAAGFLPLAKADEGYLFPDTYFWQTDLSPKQAISDMRAIFDAKITSIQGGLEAFAKSSGRSPGDIITMASIIEMEATSSADRRIVAGILWKRLEAGMALQVDPPFYYFLNKGSAALTLADLKIESPYNLYLNKGLPPTPIDSPSLSAIVDAIHPTTTKYWFYLSGRDGRMHYAVTFEEHTANKARYLN